MSDATINNLQPKASEVAPAPKVRSYWQTVGYRLRYDYMTLFFGFTVDTLGIADTLGLPPNSFLKGCAALHGTGSCRL